MGFIRKNAHVILIIIGSIFLALSVFHTNIWFDEAYSVSLVKHSFRDIWIIGGNDVHPILYYWLLKIVGIFFNYSILSYRVFSLLSIIFLGIVGYTHIRKDFGVKTGFIFSFMVFFLPIMPFYANQIRMYSLAIFFTTLLCIYGYRIYNGNSSWKNIILFGSTLRTEGVCESILKGMWCPRLSRHIRGRYLTMTLVIRMPVRWIGTRAI